MAGGDAVAAEMSVLFVNYNSWRECAVAIRSLRANPPTRRDGSPMPYECIVVDNRSPRRPPEEIELVRAALAEVAQEQGDERCGQLILHDDNAGYSKGVNLCFHRSRGRWILVSNPDLVYTPGLVPALQRHLEDDPTAGITVPKGYWDTDLSGRLPPNTLPTLTDHWLTVLGAFSPYVSWRYSEVLARQALAVWRAEQPLALPMMSGCLFLVEREFFASLGLMDERYPLYYEDSDLSRCIVRAGRRIVQVPEARLVHFVCRSGQSDPATMMGRHDVSRRLYYRKWYGRLGTASLDLGRWLLTRPWLQRWRPQPPFRPFVDLGSSTQKPVIRLGRDCREFLLQMSPDCRFYLSGGMLASGSEWTPTDAMFANFGPTTYWYRAYDTSDGRFDLLGVWRYTCCNPVPDPAAAVGSGA